MGKGVKRLKQVIEMIGTIYSDDGIVNTSNFREKLKDLLELNGWYFNGSSRQINEEDSTEHKKFFIHHNHSEEIFDFYHSKLE